MSSPYASDPGLPTHAADDKVFPVVIYVLYLLGWAGGLSLLIGFVMAYALKGGAGPRARSHFVFQIRTVWISLVWLMLSGALILVGLPLTLVLVGFLFLKLAFLLFGLIGLWFLVRSIVGLLFALRGEAYPRPRAWLV